MVSIVPIELPTSLVLQLGVGGVVGFAAGYTVKKIVKVIMVILGFFALVLLYLNYEGAVSVRWERLMDFGGRVLEFVSQKSTLLIRFATTNIPLTGSFVLGFAVGCKKG